jgi:PAS domain S-box-containing protein
MTSLEKGWIDVNDRLCSILGYSRDELLRMTWSELTHPHDLEADLGQFRRVLSGEIDGYSMEKRFIRKDGITIWTDMSVRCVRLPGGKPDYFIALVQDITERKEAEEQIKRMNEELERRVTERTAELSAKTDELERLNKVFVGRELRMRELKTRIAKLELQKP